MHERMLAGDPCLADDPVLAEQHQRAMALREACNASPAADPAGRRGVIACPGVTIGKDTVVGAGSVVTKDLPSGVLAVGSPARVVRPLPGR